jgi:hypothetical protein
MSNRCADCFKQLLESWNKQSKAFVSKVTEASYLVAELAAQKRKSDTVGENLMMPVCEITADKMLGQGEVREIEMFHLQKVR